MLNNKALCAAALVLTLLAGQSRATDTKAVSVPAGDLTAALEMLAKQSGVELVYRPEQLKGLKTRGVQGTLSSEEAVRRLIEGTTLTLHADPSGVLLISSVDAPVKASESSSAAAPALHVARAAAQANAQDAPGAQGKIEEQAEKAQTDAPKQDISEIIVTAQKRAERLQDVPMSISVLGGSELDRSSAQGITDALNNVPGVAAIVTAQSGGTRLLVRGVTADHGLFFASSPIAFYLDSVPFGFISRAVVPDSNAYDMERVEVLRGPQGTLYGASALNGVVRVLTKDPDLDRFDFKARTSTAMTKDGDPSYRGDLAANVPLIEDKLAMRVVAGYQDLGGWIDKPNANEPDANDAQISNLRFKISARPTEDLSIGLSAWRYRSDFGGPSGSADGKRSLVTFSEPASTDYDVYGLKVGYDFSNFSVTSMTSYLSFDNEYLNDIGPNFGGIPMPIFFDAESEVFSQEVSLSSTQEGPWRWTAGGIYRKGDEPGLYTLPLFPIPVTSEFTSESYAVFGELTRSFLGGKLELTGGLRYFEDRMTSDGDLSVFLGVPSPFNVGSTAKFDAVSPRVILTWHPSEKATVYTSYSEGFRSGKPLSGFFSLFYPDFPALKPDTLKNYEIGAKGSLFDGRVHFDTALYYIDWQDVQQSLTVTFNGIALAAMINGKSASGIGADFGLTTELTRGLTAGLNIGWNDLTYDSDIYSSNLLLFAAGERLSNSPEYVIGGSLDYMFPVGSNGYEGRFSVAGNYTSEQHFRTLLGGVYSTTSDTLLIGRASFSVNSPRHWATTLFVDNLNNEQGTPQRAPLGIAEHTIRLRPRTIGLQLEYRFH